MRFLLLGAIVVFAAALVLLGVFGSSGYFGVLAVVGGASVGLAALLILARLAYLDRRATRIRRRWSSAGRS